MPNRSPFNHQQHNDSRLRAHSFFPPLLEVTFTSESNARSRVGSISKKGAQNLCALAIFLRRTSLRRDRNCVRASVRSANRKSSSPGCVANARSLPLHFKTPPSPILRRASREMGDGQGITFLPESFPNPDVITAPYYIVFIRILQRERLDGITTTIVYR
ncbi:hypothetical protein BJV78DRAFT_1234506 [Lactifluus subvellereus]|nr:hypothetical protein BJV78DRAFT_1234506 [Lactifluus subvellereus]